MSARIELKNIWFNRRTVLPVLCRLYVIVILDRCLTLFERILLWRSMITINWFQCLSVPRLNYKWMPHFFSHLKWNKKFPWDPTSAYWTTRYTDTSLQLYITDSYRKASDGSEHNWCALINCLLYPADLLLKVISHLNTMQTKLIECASSNRHRQLCVSMCLCVCVSVWCRAKHYAIETTLLRVFAYLDNRKILLTFS